MNLSEFTAKYFSEIGEFKDNTTGDITPEKLRIFVNDLAKTLGVENVDSLPEGGNPPIKEFGYVREELFTGLKVFYLEGDDFFYVMLQRRGNGRIVLSDEEGDYIGNMILYDCTTSSQSIDGLDATSIVNKEQVEEYVTNNPPALFTLRKTDTDFIRTSSIIEIIKTGNTHQIVYIPDSMITSAMSANDGDIAFSTENLSDGYRLEIYFKTPASGTVQFAIKPFDIFTSTRSILANKYYKMDVRIINGYPFTEVVELLNVIDNS
jgi:hypothetical protein